MRRSWSNGQERYRYAKQDDLQAFGELLSDPEVARYLWFAPVTPELVSRFFSPIIEAQAVSLDAQEPPLSAVITVEDAEDGSFLGHGGVMAVEGSVGGFEIGFQLHQRAWGRGVGHRLGQFLCAFAIKVHDAYRIEGNCLESNAASRALLTKLGLHQEACKPGFRLRDGVRHTELVFGCRVQELGDERVLRLRKLASSLGL